MMRRARTARARGCAPVLTDRHGCAAGWQGAVRRHEMGRGGRRKQERVRPEMAKTRAEEMRTERNGLRVKTGTEREAHALDMVTSGRSGVATDSQRARFGSCTAVLEYFGVQAPAETGGRGFKRRPGAETERQLRMCTGRGSGGGCGGYGSKGYGYGTRVRDGSVKMILGGLFFAQNLSGFSDALNMDIDVKILL
ncbi:hypothetical protein B0H14DRAFT_3146650 [Mycena olivaceomarginata]|nr:hypothetical protein B0H14DRAFT_3146650 [Mycena olivaceomarginata]